MNSNLFINQSAIAELCSTVESKYSTYNTLVFVSKETFESNGLAYALTHGSITVKIPCSASPLVSIMSIVDYQRKQGMKLFCIATPEQANEMCNFPHFTNFADTILADALWAPRVKRVARHCIECNAIQDMKLLAKFLTHSDQGELDFLIFSTIESAQEFPTKMAYEILDQKTKHLSGSAYWYVVNSVRALGNQACKDLARYAHEQSPI